MKKIKFIDNYIQLAGVLFLILIVAGLWIYPAKYQNSSNWIVTTQNTLEEQVIPSAGVILPVRWGNIGARMVSSGVIDSQKFRAIYSKRGGIDNETEKLLTGENNGNIKITRQNSGIILNLLWALGLGNKNSILENGPMMKYNGNASNFASTGGWTLAIGNVMDHYSRYQFIKLTAEQQVVVERVSKNIYRPCCNNSTYFPDCNHGMAMLGLIELMASQGISEEDMYKIALAINSYWFPDTYLTIAEFLKSKGIAWGKADSKEILGYNFSSASGYQKILSEFTSVKHSGGGSCGI